MNTLQPFKVKTENTEQIVIAKDRFIAVAMAAENLGCEVVDVLSCEPIKMEKRRA